ncbi:outer membrane beta-barrel protein [Colwellia sp. 12G3]|uniref:outer membrane beta-barrel protein n=1 Tax=Colwellia sp. 12G3 TaxID=2058299 RepID=UPI0012FE9AD1|nr:outer membrane beta-barrel protein [Colwellia sp. 12G3]
MLFVLAQPCLAVDNISSNGKNHTLGINLGLDSVDTDISSESDDGGIITGFTYGYKFDSTWTVNTGKVFGGSFCIVTCFGDVRVLDYDSYILNIKGSLPLSNRWSVFGKLGVNYYNVMFSGGNRVNVIDTGVGTLLATGFDFRAYNGFGLGFEMTLLDMGNILAKNVTLNFSYMF